MRDKLAPMKNRFLEFSRKSKIAILLFLDLLSCLLSEYIALGLRTDEWGIFTGAQASIGVASFLVTAIASVVTKLYFYTYRYFGINNFFILLKICFFNFLFLLVLLYLFPLSGVPRSLAILIPLIYLFITVGLRVSAAEYFSNNSHPQDGAYRKQKRILIYGAGSAGRQLAAGLEISKEVFLLGYIDRNPTLKGAIINGLHVYSADNLDKILTELHVDEILLAIPSISISDRSRICSELLKFRIKVRILPGVTEVATGRIVLESIRDLEISDLLGRAEVSPNFELMSKSIFNKTILITGGGGSIGSQLVRQLIVLRPRKLIIIENSEYALYQIIEDVTAKYCHLDYFKDLEFFPMIGSIQDKEFIHSVFDKHSPEVVYHAAAYKHVPIVESNWAEGIKNNVFGTLVCVEASIAHKVSDFILISSDKAVRPTNIMGATKRLSEMIVQAHANEIRQKNVGTRFSMVRFGNVLGSSGSVVPLFAKQIKGGGPVTVTDERITRYFMTIEEAVQLVIQAGSLAKGGEVYLLDMGEPIKIYDLAERMINLYGFSIKNQSNPGGDIEIKVIGLRPGEKLYEELLIDGSSQSTIVTKIKVANEGYLPIEEIRIQLEQVMNAVKNDNLTKLICVFQRIIDGYMPDEIKTSP